MLIVLEGGDGAGKSTQCKLLGEHFDRNGARAVLLRYPDRTTVTGSIINRYLKGEAVFCPQAINLVLLANLWELGDQIKKHLEEGAIVILDRYQYTNYAYSMARGCTLQAASAPATGLPVPDAVVLLDIPPDEALKRKAGQQLEVLESLDFQKKVCANFSAIKQSDWIVVDGSQTQDIVHQRIVSGLGSPSQ